MCAMCDEQDALENAIAEEEALRLDAQPFVKAERARIREWAEAGVAASDEKARTYDPYWMGQFDAYESLLDFLKERR